MEMYDELEYKEDKKQTVDIMYTGDVQSTQEFLKQIKEKFPEFKIEEEWDEIHEDRVMVTFDISKNKEYFEWVLKEGWGAISFIVQISIRENEKERVPGINEALESFKKMIEEKKKNAVGGKVGIN